MVEQFFTALIWELLGDYPTGMAVTGGMGNQSKADVILRLSRERIRKSEVIERIEFACKAFNILRENRNMLIHSHSIFRSDNGGKPTWHRAAGKGPRGHISAEADFEDLETLIAQTCALGIFTTELIPFLHPKRRRHWVDKKPPELPATFPLPQILRQPAPEAAPPPKSKRKPGKRSNRQPNPKDA